MPRKTERWLEDIFSNGKNSFSKYDKLTDREFIIVSSSALDTALADLISLRLKPITKELESFLGLNEDGRAPVATFGARIQLALLLGLINENDASIFRIYKKIRNYFSHRVNINLLSPQIIIQMKQLILLWIKNLESLNCHDYVEMIKKQKKNTLVCLGSLVIY